MIRVYIKDNKIIKTVNGGYFEKEHAPEGATYQDLPFDITDHLVYEDDSVKLYKDSKAIEIRKKELENIEQRSELEQRELDYILSLLS